MLSVCIARSPATGAGSASDGKIPTDGAGTASAASDKIEQAIAKQETFKNMELTLSNDPEERFHALGDIAKAAYEADYCDKAWSYLRQLLRLASHNRGDCITGRRSRRQISCSDA
jgi:hypothetical protein